MTLRAFYEVVGAVNFVGEPPKAFPDREILDPLQIEPFGPQMPMLCSGESSEVVLCADPLLKYFIGGVGPITLRVPDACFDPVLIFEGEGLKWNGIPLTLASYLREVILRRGGIGLIAGCNDDGPDASLTASLTDGLTLF